MIASVFTLSGCESSSKTVKAAKPGTYDLTYNRDDNKLKKNTNYTTVLAFNPNGYGENNEYVAKLEKYGFEKPGFSVYVRNKWIYPCTYENVKIKFSVTYTYDTYVSAFKTETKMSEPIEFEIDLDENGNGSYIYTAPADTDDNVFCKYAFNMRVNQYRVLEVSGKATVLPRNEEDFIPGATAKTASTN